MALRHSGRCLSIVLCVRAIGFWVETSGAQTGLASVGCRVQCYVHAFRWVLVQSLNPKPHALDDQTSRRLVQNR